MLLRNSGKNNANSQILPGNYSLASSPGCFSLRRLVLAVRTSAKYPRFSGDSNTSSILVGLQTMHVCFMQVSKGVGCISGQFNVSKTYLCIVSVVVPIALRTQPLQAMHKGR